MPTYNISVNPALARIIEREIKSKKYSNRSEFFRSLVRWRYVDGKDYMIEKLSSADPDYNLLQTRKKSAKGHALIEQIIDELPSNPASRSAKRSAQTSKIRS